jgi:hypothetical protein
VLNTYSVKETIEQKAIRSQLHFGG